MSEPTRPCHRTVLRILDTLDAGFLERARCFFGGGTRIVLALGEYRESADVDFLCANGEGYRMLRSTVGDASLGRIAKPGLRLAREVIADRYGIRTVIETGGEKLKFEIILEGRIGLSGGSVDGLPVPALDPRSCCAEKFLANADRWNDESVLGRDAIDLAFMGARWGREPLRAGLEVATEAYGKVVARAARRAATKLLEQAAWRRRCIAALSLTDTRTLLSGLRLLAAGRR
ncbi:MAG: nucleotidyl transferase AbiEii/AbiGii toxin family protein [Betaproteobacteria bacterium]|nr:nucleotidyl transferase AbiEii/AbiGii toxin family protein [Betaproteobacteria bacterium]